MDMPAIAVTEYLRKHGIPEDVITRFEINSIDSITFALINDDDLRDLSIVDIRQRKYILLVSLQWRRYIEQHCINGYSHQIFSTGKNAFNCSTLSSSPRLSQPVEPDFVSLLNGEKHPLSIKSDAETLNSFDAKITPDSTVQGAQNRWKVLLSFIYFFMSAGITSTAVAIAHERLPDISKFPPLPDLVLDRLPFVPWAFKAAESIGVIFTIIWMIILFFHRYRCILIRRFLSLAATIFLLRSFTMLITSLSVPASYLSSQCKLTEDMNHTDRFKRVFKIWTSMGLSIGGVHTCGDYMFSGHTSWLTLFNFFIIEYSPSNWCCLHALSWILYILGIFLVLASHEHYSIDVFIAIYISSRLFLYYHCLASDRCRQQSVGKRLMTCFPIFYFFECDVPASVTNAYEWPWKLCFLNPFYLSKLSRAERFRENETLPYFTKSNSTPRISQARGPAITSFRLANQQLKYI